MYFIFVSILFYQLTLALIYNDICTNKCDFPGMICVNNRCICDSKNRLFWTNARCAPCPNNWTMTETACIIYYETEMSWERAKLTCRDLNAELISFRNRDLISLINNVTNKKQSSGSINKLSAWTSAHEAGLSTLSVYRWLDKNVNTFDDKSDWWCKNNTPNLGYIYNYNEPTRYTDDNNETEACVAYWRSTINTQVVCLDDQLCSQEFAFICEKSESTANQYIGPPPEIIDPFNINNDVRIDIIHTVPVHVGTVIVRTANRTPSPNQTPIGVIIISMIGVLLLLALLGGVFFFLKRRSTTEKLSNVNGNKRARRSSKKSGTSENDTAIKDESIDPNTNTSESENVDININEQKQQKSRRGGYSKQQFDELE